MSVRLRPYRETDAGALATAARESVAEVRPWMPWCHAEFCEAEAHSWIQRKLEILVATGNAASARVAQKAGAQLEGRLRSRLVLHGVPHDAFLYSLTIERAGPPEQPHRHD